MAMHRDRTIRICHGFVVGVNLGVTIHSVIHESKMFRLGGIIFVISHFPNRIDPLHDDVSHHNNPRRALHCGSTAGFSIAC